MQCSNFLQKLSELLTNLNKLIKNKFHFICIYMQQ